MPGGRCSQFQGSILLEDASVKFLERLPWIDAELICQDPPSPIERHERVALAASAVQSKHQIPPQDFPEGESSHQRLELGDDLGVTSGHQVCLQSQLQRLQPPLFQASDLTRSERDVGQVM